VLRREPHRRLGLGLRLDIAHLLLDVPPLLHLRVLGHCLQQLVLLVVEGETPVGFLLEILVPAPSHLLGLLLLLAPVLGVALDGGRRLLLPFVQAVPL